MLDSIKNIESRCRKMKLKALDMALSTGAIGSHIGGGFSAMELLATLYSVVNIPDMDDENRDRIIISKGHCVLAYYTALWQYGYIPEAQLETFDKDGTKLHGHPHKNKKYGIEFSGGSLGLGLSYAVGVAMACKMKSLSNTIYVLLGDGECDEGIVWEALMSISNFRLDNIVLIVDKNKYQLDGPTVDIMNQYSLYDKFKAFGFDVINIDGHDINQIQNVLTSKRHKQIAVIADTIKANGISFLMNNKMSHQCPISKKKYEQAVTEINQAYDAE